MLGGNGTPSLDKLSDTRRNAEDQRAGGDQLSDLTHASSEPLCRLVMYYIILFVNNKAQGHSNVLCEERTGLTR